MRRCWGEGRVSGVLPGGRAAGNAGACDTAKKLRHCESPFERGAKALLTMFILVPIHACVVPFGLRHDGHGRSPNRVILW
jgi:hypothetical protein